MRTYSSPHFQTWPCLSFMRGKFISLAVKFKRDDWMAAYFFLPAACLAVTAAFAFAVAVLVLLCFCVDFFWLAFGDLSPMIDCFL